MKAGRSDKYIVSYLEHKGISRDIAVSKIASLRQKSENIEEVSLFIPSF